MNKEKIAISIDSSLLRLIDSKTDGGSLRSRSQAIEYFLKRGIKDENICAAVLLLKGSRQGIALRPFKGAPLIRKQLEFFSGIGIEKVYVITQNPKKELREELRNTNAEIVTGVASGNAEALLAIKDKISGNFLVMSGDTYNKFDSVRMINKHVSLNKLATVGLITKEELTDCGTVILDGDQVIEFKEKGPKPLSHIVNAGIYLFKPEIFELIEGPSLESDLFPKLAKIRELAGFFTYGEYEHFK